MVAGAVGQSRDAKGQNIQACTLLWLPRPQSFLRSHLHRVPLCAEYVGDGEALSKIAGSKFRGVQGILGGCFIVRDCNWFSCSRSLVTNQEESNCLPPSSPPSTIHHRRRKIYRQA